VKAVSQPYLSVIVTARNDDHGGNLLGRMQAFVNGLLNQCARHKLPAELIIVDWNPLEDRPGLADALHWNASRENSYCDVRVVEVPRELHRTLEHWRTLPLYQMIAKNVGIRRACGEFILATNIDILFSDELMSFIAARRLERGKMYRIDRWDIESGVPVDAPVEEQLAYAKTHMIRVCAREGTYRVSSDGVPILEKNDIATADGGVRLGDNWFPREISGEEPFRWVENDAELLIDPALGSEKVLVLDAEPGPGVHMGAFWLELRDGVGNRLGSVLVKRRTIVTFPLPRTREPLCVSLHTVQGGNKIAFDPRTLNFRVYRCDLETASGAKGRVDRARARAGQSWISRAGRGLRLLRDFCTSSVQFRVPMSQHSLDRLHMRQDGGGISFFAGPLTGLLRRGDAALRGILGPGVGAVWGDGWYPPEAFRGDTLRWMRHRGTLVLQLPPSPVSEISLVVESGPAVGFAPVDLEIQDQWGTSLAKGTIKGRTRLNVPIPRAQGAISLSLIVHGGGEPKELVGDSRALVLRLVRCECKLAAKAMPAGFQPIEMRPRGRIWRGRGWKPGIGGRGLSAAGQADLILRATESPSRLTLGVEVADPTPMVVAIRDSYGRELFRGPVQGAQEIAIPGVYEPGTYCALHFETEGGGEQTGARRFTLTTVTWASRDAPPVTTTIRVDRGRDLAVHLHTNACGDFTMMAREHWTDLRGYAELDVFSMNVDSLLCWTAHHGGAPEEFLDSPMRIFHIEHATGSGWTPEGEAKLYTRIAEKGIPWLSYDDVVEWARTMNQFNAPIIFNHDSWGFGSETLREARPLQRGRASASQ
jgi:hypothetical protein